MILGATVVQRAVGDDVWPQFRGVNGSGRATMEASYPSEIGPDTNVVWKVPLPPGHSSPIVYGNRVYVTAVRDTHLLTIGLDRLTGSVLWEAEAPFEELEQIHSIGSYVQCTPATDGDRVVSFFGSSGLFCYDSDGALLWSRPMGPFNNIYGAANSPILVDDRVILCQDQDTDSFLTALDKHTGEELWKTDRSEFPWNYCTPVVWEHGDTKQIVVAATLRAVGYDFETGEEVWTVRGLSRHVGMTPVVSEDGQLIVAAYAPGGDVGDVGSRMTLEPFDQLAPKRDANGDGVLQRGELAPEDLAHSRFFLIDREKDGVLSRAEYERYRGFFDRARNVIVSIRPGGRGDVTESHVQWEYTKHLPLIASPLAYQGHVFMIKDGGILTSLDANTGTPLKTRRISATGNYYSSPVAADGKVYLVNQRGQLTVVSGEAQWRVLATADFGEDVYATPALVGGDVFLRTVSHLYCFRSQF